ncbi:MAG TPA: 4-hydroxy-3-methylbut-2-enyl diphosphate reductase, partial [Candidatus Saccharimonadales bacterium]|nr:4-hydroxy-3-methylbut-2-enyl diphosphate reductase [Candidatus Saccharimonadales bacterium]
MNIFSPAPSDYFVMQSECQTRLPAQGAFKIIRAVHLGMCFGVRDAIAAAHQHAQTESLTILGDLVHNETVLAGLRARGIRIENRIEDVATPSVMITAHGAADKTLQAIKERGLHVLEATCPLVQNAHRAVKALVQENFHPVIIGQRDHVEVRGLTGDLAQFDVVLTPEDVFQLAERPRFGVAAQTTQPIDRVRYLVELMRQRFPASEIRCLDTVCQPTKQRQTAAIEMAQQADVVIVIGGAQSNNTRELTATCRRFCGRVHQVANASDLRAEWFAEVEMAG